MRTEHLIYSCVNVSIELVLSLCLKSFSYRSLRSVFYPDIQRINMNIEFSILLLLFYLINNSSYDYSKKKNDK